MIDYYTINCSRCGRAFARTNADPALMSDAPVCRGCRETAPTPPKVDEYDLRMILHAYETGVGHGQQGRGVEFKDRNWGDRRLAFAYREGVQQGEKEGHD